MSFKRILITVNSAPLSLKAAKAGFDLAMTSMLKLPCFIQLTVPKKV